MMQAVLRQNTGLDQHGQPPTQSAQSNEHIKLQLNGLRSNLKQKFQQYTMDLKTDLRQPPLFNASDIESYIDDRITTTYKKLLEAQNPETIKTTLFHYIINIVATISGDQQQALSENARALLFNICQVLLEQNLFDPPKYSAHDLHHAMYVANTMHNISELDPQFIAVGKAKYNLNKPTLQSLYQLLGLLHDIGYPKLEDLKPTTKPTHKASHATFGSVLFSQEIAPQLLQVLLQSGIERATAQTIIKDFKSAIHHHCADSPDNLDSPDEQTIWSSWQIAGPLVIAQKNIPQVSNFFNEQGDTLLESKAFDAKQDTRCTDLIATGDSLVSVQCAKISVNESPFDVLLRISDNCHIDENRLATAQKEKYLYLITKNIENEHNREFTSSNIRAAFETVMADTQLSRVNQVAQWAIVSKLDAQDWSFRASSLWIDSVQISMKVQNQQSLLTIYCHFKSSLGSDFPTDESSDHDNPKKLQVERLEKALEWVDYPATVVSLEQKTDLQQSQA